MADKYPLQVFGRLATCTRCKQLVDLIEIPKPEIDLDRYVCGTCLVPINQNRNAQRIFHGLRSAA